MWSLLVLLLLLATVAARWRPCAASPPMQVTRCLQYLLSLTQRASFLLVSPSGGLGVAAKVGLGTDSWWNGGFITERAA